MMWLNLAAVGFVMVLLATACLFGELIVKARGVLGFIGLGLIVIYFSYHLTPDNFFWLCLLYAGGLILIILDFKLLNHGVFAVLGLLIMMISLALPAPSFTFGVLVCLAFIAGLPLSFLSLKFLPARDLWSKLTLKDQLSTEKGYNTMDDSYHNLVGCEGVTITPFRPIGTVEINNQPYSAITEGKWLKKDVPVIVNAVDGTRIVIREKKQQE